MSLKQILCILYVLFAVNIYQKINKYLSLLTEHSLLVRWSFTIKVFLGTKNDKTNCIIKYQGCNRIVEY